MERAVLARSRKRLRSNGNRRGTERATGNGMVLLVTSCSRAAECAAVIERDLGDSTEVAPTLRRGLELLRRRPFAAVLVDEILTDADPAGAEALYRETDGAVPVTMNLAISGPERVVREVRSALHRRESELRNARHAAARELRSELTDAVTGILLSSQLALENPAVPADAVAQIRTVYELAASLRERLSAA